MSLSVAVTGNPTAAPIGAFSATLRVVDEPALKLGA